MIILIMTVSHFRCENVFVGQNVQNNIDELTVCYMLVVVIILWRPALATLSVLIRYFIGPRQQLSCCVDYDRRELKRIRVKKNKVNVFIRVPEIVTNGRAALSS